jgi:hypothetical protein
MKGCMGPPAPSGPLSQEPHLRGLASDDARIRLGRQPSCAATRTGRLLVTRRTAQLAAADEAPPPESATRRRPRPSAPNARLHGSADAYA